MQNIKLLTTVSVLVLLSACGFHLRGQLAVPEYVQPLYLAGANPNGDLHREVRLALERADVELATAPSEANYQLILLEEERDRRTLTIGSGAESAEYALIETARFEVRNQAGEVVLGPRELSERRVILNDPNNPTGTAQEEAMLFREMVRSLATRIAGQLRALKAPTAQG